MASQQSQLHKLDKKRIRRSFDLAAEHYDEAAVLQQEVGRRILERLQLIRHSPAVILDVGAGTGVHSRALGSYYRKARILSLDLAPRMLHVASRHLNWLESRFGRQHFVCGDAEQLPIADQSVDMIFSNLTLQWCGELEQAFLEFRRVLKPQGLVMFSTFGPDTLKELRHSWQTADDGSNTVHVNDFIDMHDIGDALLRAGLQEAVMDVEHITLTYPDVFQLMRELKAIGAHNVAQDRRHSLTGKQRLKAMAAAYETFRHNDKLPATYEVVYGHAWSPAGTGNRISIPVTAVPANRD